MRKRRYLRLLTKPAGITSLLFLALCIAGAVGADWFASYDPYDPGDKNTSSQPSPDLRPHIRWGPTPPAATT